MKIGFTGSPLLTNKVIAIYAIAMTAVAGGILLIPAQAPTPNVVYNLFKIGQTTADPAQLATGWKSVGYSCQAALPGQIAQGSGATVCGYKYTTASHNLITQAGIDWLACIMSRGSNHCQNTNNAQFIALSLDSTAPLIGDTTLAAGSGEIIATSCGAANSGLQRIAGLYTHTNLTTATYQVSNTFLAGTGVNCVGVQKSGLFTKLAAGTMVFENTFSSTNLLAQDTLAITWTITL